MTGFSLLNFAKIPQTNNHGFPLEKQCVARQTLEQKSTKSVSEKEVVPIAKQKIKPSKTVKSKSSVHISLGGMLLLLLFYLLLIGMFVGGIFALCKGRIWLGIVSIAIPVLWLTGIILSNLLD